MKTFHKIVRYALSVAPYNGWNKDDCCNYVDCDLSVNHMPQPEPDWNDERDWNG